MRDPSAATAPGGAPRRQPLALPRRVTGMRPPAPSRRRDMCGVQLRNAPVAGIKAVVAAGLFSAPLQRAAGAARPESEREPPRAGRAGRAAQHPQVSVMPAGPGVCVPGAAGRRAVRTWVTRVVTRTGGTWVTRVVTRAGRGKVSVLTGSWCRREGSATLMVGTPKYPSWVCWCGVFGQLLSFLTGHWGQRWQGAASQAGLHGKRLLDSLWERWAAPRGPGWSPWLGCLGC